MQIVEAIDQLLEKKASMWLFKPTPYGDMILKRTTGCQFHEDVLEFFLFTCLLALFHAFTILDDVHNVGMVN